MVWGTQQPPSEDKEKCFESPTPHPQKISRFGSVLGAIESKDSSMTVQLGSRKDGLMESRYGTLRTAQTGSAGVKRFASRA